MNRRHAKPKPGLVGLRSRRRCGTSLIEALGTLLILAFLTMGTCTLYTVGNQNQRTDRFYTWAQTDLREALRRITRTIRHSSGVQMNSTVTNFSGAPNSGSTQIIVAVPQSNATGTDYIRIYRDGSGNVYAQRQDDTGSGTKLMDGSSAMTINYYQTTTTSTGSSTAAVDGAPASATEAQVTLSVTRGSVTTKSVAYVTMRNTILGL